MPETPQWQLGGIDPEDWSNEEVTTPKPALSKRRLRKGYAPPVAIRGLADVVNDIEVTYLAHAPGNMLSDPTLTKERMEVMHMYNEKQVRIASIPVDPSLGVDLPLLGMSFIPALPTVHAEIPQRTRRGNPPMSTMGVLPHPLGCSTL